MSGLKEGTTPAKVFAEWQAERKTTDEEVAALSDARITQAIETLSALRMFILWEWAKLDYDRLRHLTDAQLLLGSVADFLYDADAEGNKR